MSGPIGRGGRDIDDGAAVLFPHDRQHVLAGQHGAEQVDVHDPVEGRGRDVLERRVAAFDADADIVVQDVDSAPLSGASRDDRFDCRLIRHVRGGGERFAALLGDHVGGFLRRVQVTVHAANPGAFAGENQRRRAAVADGFAGAGRLAGPDDHGDLIL